MKPPNLFDDIPDELPEELFTTLLSAPGLRVERIVSTGQQSPPGFWYDQSEDEWVVVLQGAAAIEFEGDVEPVRLAPGDWLNIPAHCRHRVAWTALGSRTVWLAIHYLA